MSKQFFPAEAPIERRWSTSLQADGIMPAAMVCILTPDRRQVLATTHHGRPSGLPIIDLANIQEAETAAQYVAYRLRKRYDYPVPKSQIRELPYRSAASAYLSQGISSSMPHLHRRIFYPFVGLYNHQPEDPRLTLAAPAEVVDKAAMIGPKSRLVMQQIIGLQHELFSDLVGLAYDTPADRLAN